MKLTLNRETLKVLKVSSLKEVAGAGPVPSFDLACPELTAKVDCA